MLLSEAQAMKQTTTTLQTEPLRQRNATQLNSTKQQTNLAQT